MNETKCCEWKGTLNYKGYGVVSIGGKQFRVHRLAVILSGRKIPKDKVVDHICRNRACINPEHLRVVTSVENVMSGTGFAPKNKLKTHCLRGHPYEVHGRSSKARKGSGGTWRQCKLCDSELAKQKYYERK